MTQTQSDLGRVQLKRVNSFRGLMIDADVWRDAHEYHRSLMRLHQLALHGWGIVHGLDVALDAADNTVVVQPGIAVDPGGHFIVVTQPYVHRLEAPRPGPIYLVIQYAEVPSGPTQPANDPYGQPTRIVEAYRIVQRADLPSTPRLELCRVQYDPLAGRLKAPSDATNPGPNELDLRFRIPLALTGQADADAGGPAMPDALPVSTGWVQEPLITRPGAAGQPATASAAAAGGVAAAGAAPITVVTVRHAGQGWDAHQDGLGALAREMGYSTRPVITREASLGDADADTADVLYLTGHGRLELGDTEVEALGRALERGAAVVGDGCAAGPRGDAGAREFAHSFSELAETVGRRLVAVERGHAVFTGRHRFAVAPPGARSSTVILADGALVYCDSDYGCAWAGGAPAPAVPLPRGAIRDAQELGANLLTLSKPAEPPAHGLREA